MNGSTQHFNLRQGVGRNGVNISDSVDNQRNRGILLNNARNVSSNDVAPVAGK